MVNVSFELPVVVVPKSVLFEIETVCALFTMFVLFPCTLIPGNEEFTVTFTVLEAEQWVLFVSVTV